MNLELGIFFSIIIPTYNRAQLASRAIDSVLKQSFKDYEIIVVDDGSTDDTKEVIESLRHPQIKYIFQENAGASKARNLGAGAARGEFLIFLDSDDFISENYLQGYSNALGSERKHTICLGSAAFFTRLNATPFQEIKPFNKDGFLGPALCGAYAIAKDLFLEMGGFDTKLFYSENTDLFFRLSLENRYAAADVVFVANEGVYIYTEDTRGRESRYSKVKYSSSKYFLEKHRTFFDHSEKDFINFKRIHAWSAFMNHEYKEARSSIREVIRKNPYVIKSYLQYVLFLFPKIAAFYANRRR